MRNSNDIIGNGTCKLPACSAVPQLTAPPRTPVQWVPAISWGKAAGARR